MTGDGLAIRSERTEAAWRFVVSGELDIATADRLRERLADPEAGSADTTVVDLAAVTFMDSSGLHALLDVARRHEGRVRIIPSPACARLFEITGLAGRLPVFSGGLTP